MLPISPEVVPDHEVHVYHHSEPARARVGIKVERNSRSINWEISISDASSPEEAVKLFLETLTELGPNLPAA